MAAIEYWVCPRCRSLNREVDTRCYSCRGHVDELERLAGLAAPGTPEAAGTPANGDPAVSAWVHEEWDGDRGG